MLQGIKALVLTAGPGTRLLPHTKRMPKPLFPVAGQPIVEIIIRRLIEQGVSAIAVNTHHLHEQVEAFIKSRSYPVPVVTRYEPEMMGTGGAITNFADFLGDRKPFLVINSDILTDINVTDAVKQHKANLCAATLIVHDCPEFNKVRVDGNSMIKDFSGKPQENERCLAFTGIQVIDPAIYDYIPAGPHVDIIEVYRSMIRGGQVIMAHESRGHYWYDLGTPERYFRAAADTLAPEAFKKAFNRKPASGISRRQLAGDGSERRWFRVAAENMSLILADHGIQTETGISEFDSFVLIGRHMREKGIPVPEIYQHERLPGLVFLQDLGDTLLQTAVKKARNKAEVEGIYRHVIKNTVQTGLKAAEGLDPAWCWQEPAFGKDTVIEKEGMYFVRAFLGKYLDMENIDTGSLAGEFARIADVIENCGITGFMHRDLQSRNIMVTEKGYFFIDFQGARKGPIQYDLASLITDPYAELDQGVRERLLCSAMDQLAPKIRGFNKKSFLKGYLYCAISRNLQALGAYGYLTRVKGKTGFEKYMRPALNNLRQLLDPARQPCLTETAVRAQNILKSDSR
ncbi:MAG: sugar phosphate nucleotidyltransferase [Desulfosalsimonas sp.]